MGRRTTGPIIRQEDLGGRAGGRVVEHRQGLPADLNLLGVQEQLHELDLRQAVLEPMLLHWAGQMCDLLEYLHKQDPPCVLGCLSPAAIHVDETGHVQVIEVGLIRYKQSGLLGPAKGVRGYAAPEQRRGEVTPLSDLYALGMILYQLITRADPRQRPLPSLHKYARGFSEQVVDAVTQAYRREPGGRYASASDMRQALLGTTSRTIAPALCPHGRPDGCHGA